MRAKDLLHGVWRAATSNFIYHLPWSKGTLKQGPSFLVFFYDSIEKKDEEVRDYKCNPFLDL